MQENRSFPKRSGCTHIIIRIGILRRSTEAAERGILRAIAACREIGHTGNQTATEEWNMFLILNKIFEY